MNNEGEWVTSKNACKFYGVTANTLRKYANNNSIISKRTQGHQRVYFIPSSNSNASSSTKTENSQNYIYCRVSSQKQQDDLQRQIQFLSDKFPDYQVIKDIGSGLNYKRKGLLKLLELSNRKQVGSIVVFSKDRLCRFGFELLEWQFKQNNTELVVLEQTDKTPEQEFTEDILAILQVFACRWNGKRKYNNNKINNQNKVTIELNTKENIKHVE